MGNPNNPENARLMCKFCNIMTPIAGNINITKILAGLVTSGEPVKTTSGLKVLFMYVWKNALIPCDREH